jgi:hypothetical protein
MSIESKIPQEEEINIQNLSLEVPEHKVGHFELNELLTDERRQSIKNALLDSRQKEMFIDFLELAPSAHILGLTQDAQLFDSEKHKVEDVIQKQIIDDDLKSFSRLAAKAKIINIGINFKLSYLNGGRIRSVLEQSRSSSLTMEFPTKAMDLKVLFPELFLLVTKEDLELVEADIKDYRERNIWQFFAEAGSDLKIVDPSRDIGVTEKDWAEMKKELAVLAVSPLLFANMLAQMRILAAEEVKVTGQGLEITDHKPNLSKPTQALPEIKKF